MVFYVYSLIFIVINSKAKQNKYFSCIFFENLLLRNENTKKIQAKTRINDPFKNDEYY